MALYRSGKAVPDLPIFYSIKVTVMKFLALTARNLALHFGLSLIGAVLGFWLGSYGDIIFNIDTRIVGSILGAVCGGLLLGQATMNRLVRAVLSAIAAGTPGLYLLVQNRAVLESVLLIMLWAGIGYLATSSVIAFAKILSGRATKPGDR
jgi:hypothetical protein